MANQQHLDLLKQGVEVWNKWRKNYRRIKADFTGADLPWTFLRGVNLTEADISKAYLQQADLTDAILVKTNLTRTVFKSADLTGADLTGARLIEADLKWAYLARATLSKANFIGADFKRSDLYDADLSEANLTGADLRWTNLCEAHFNKANLSEAHFNNANLIRADIRGAKLINADLSGADLSWANLSDADLSEANLTGCLIYAISAWNVHLEKTIQSSLIITKDSEPTITVDNLEVAQFIYLLLNNKKIRDVIDTITSKVVLILGRFTSERKVILDALRNEFRKQNYLPVLFDFDKPASRNFTETVSTLAHMARFVVADITEPKSIPQVLQIIIPHLPSVPIQPILQVPDCEYGMYEHFISYPWVQPIDYYRDLDELLHSIQEHIIDPAEKKVIELAIAKAKRLERP